VNFSLGLKGFGQQLDALLGDAGAHPGPVIFSGDFNTWSRWRMDLLLRKMEAAGLRRVEFEAEAPMPRWLSAKSLDHVFHSHGRFALTPSKARILGSVRSSDHAPLLVDFV
jgi:endonuclease/exonuclease/phosphatase (EEP) superfamily protein YafD